MLLDTTGLDLAIAGLASEVQVTETLDGSVEALLAGQADAMKKAVADALAADAAANATTIKAAVDAISATQARFHAANTTLAAAVTAGTPPPAPVA